jgi:hypothetical protein
VSTQPPARNQRTRQGPANPTRNQRPQGTSEPAHELKPPQHTAPAERTRSRADTNDCATTPLGIAKTWWTLDHCSSSPSASPRSWPSLTVFGGCQGIFPALTTPKNCYTTMRDRGDAEAQSVPRNPNSQPQGEAKAATATNRKRITPTRAETRWLLLSRARKGHRSRTVGSRSIQTFHSKHQRRLGSEHKLLHIVQIKITEVIQTELQQRRIPRPHLQNTAVPQRILQHQVAHIQDGLPTGKRIGIGSKSSRLSRRNISLQQSRHRITPSSNTASRTSSSRTTTRTTSRATTSRSPTTRSTTARSSTTTSRRIRLTSSLISVSSSLVSSTGTVGQLSSLLSNRLLSRRRHSRLQHQKPQRNQSRRPSHHKRDSRQQPPRHHLLLQHRPINSNRLSHLRQHKRLKRQRLVRPLDEPLLRRSTKFHKRSSTRPSQHSLRPQRELQLLIRIQRRHLSSHRRITQIRHDQPELSHPPTVHSTRRQLSNKLRKRRNGDRTLLDHRPVRILLRPSTHREIHVPGQHIAGPRRMEQHPRSAIGAGQQVQLRWLNRGPVGRITDHVQQHPVDHLTGVADPYLTGGFRPRVHRKGDTLDRRDNAHPITISRRRECRKRTVGTAARRLAGRFAHRPLRHSAPAGQGKYGIAGLWTRCRAPLNRH